MIFNTHYPYIGGGGGGVPKYEYTGKSTFIDDGSGNWRLKFLTSGTLTLKNKIVVDVFLVGGGAGGGSNTNPYGAGSGYTKTVKSITLAANTAYEIVVGAGGMPQTDGGETSGFGITVSGGSGKNGGSGGGTGGNPGRNGGSDGSDGYTDSINTAGKGQGTTTREFGEPTGKLYSGGGGGAGRSSSTCGFGGDGGGGDGAYNTNAKDCEENTGSGGGGAYHATGGKGGSGIAIIRNAR